MPPIIPDASIYASEILPVGEKSPGTSGNPGKASAVYVYLHKVLPFSGRIFHKCNGRKKRPRRFGKISERNSWNTLEFGKDLFYNNSVKIQTDRNAPVGKAGARFMLHIVLVEPEIPPNCGNIARTCAATGSRLHLVEPLGFDVSDRAVKRAGLDYWHLVEVEVHPSLPDLLRSIRRRRITSGWRLPKPPGITARPGFPRTAGCFSGRKPRDCLWRSARRSGTGVCVFPW